MRDVAFWIFLLMLTTKGTPVSLRFVVGTMLIMAAVLLLISFIGSFTGLGPMPLWYIALPVLLLGVASYFGPRVRCNLRVWYPQKVKRFEQVETVAFVAFLIYMWVHLIRS
jgi:hypothetical protein